MWYGANKENPYAKARDPVHHIFSLNFLSDWGAVKLWWVAPLSKGYIAFK